MKAIVLLKDYRNIDFGCNVEVLHSEIDESYFRNTYLTYV